MQWRAAAGLLVVSAVWVPYACGGTAESPAPASGGSTQDASAGQAGTAQGGTGQGGTAGQGGGVQGGAAGQGGGVQGGAAGQGGAGGAAGQGGSATGGASGNAGSAQGGAAGGYTEPFCAERGGQCVMMQSLSEPCPTGSYNPFSGSLDKCMTSVIRRCCVPTGELGSPCDLTNTCSNGGCLSEGSGYPPGGYCTSVCDPNASQCPSWATCLTVMWSAAMGNCMVKCDSNDRCREGWSCEAFKVHPFSTTDPTTTYACWQAGSFGKGLGETCASDGDCLSQLCRQNRCSATCDNANPCIPGYTCASGTCS